jgi:hypothetical protein
MTNQKLEAYLLASRPTDGAYSAFTQSIIDNIRSSARKDSSKRPALWQSIYEFTMHSNKRNAVALILVVFVTAFIGLSGYAYANGTNPFSLIKRWVVGNEVKVNYRDPQTDKQREFRYGAKRSYSDVAISAFAEISLTDLLHFHATNAYTVPKNGIEYIVDPFRTEYIAPRIGTIEQIGPENVVLHLTYSPGQSKMEPSHDIDERVTIPRSQFYYYKNAKLATLEKDSAGKLVEIFQNQYLEHHSGSGQKPLPIDLYSAFALSYPMNAIKEATSTKGRVEAKTDKEIDETVTQQDLQEIGVGALSDTCLGNGADSCPHAFKDEHGENFFISSIVPGEYGGPSRQNPNMIAFGEAVLEPTDANKQYMLRHIEGKITKINSDQITIKTPSGNLWTFQYSTEHQKTFAKVYKQPLKIGDLLAGGVIASVYDWDQRNFSNQYVYGMSRYE